MVMLLKNINSIKNFKIKKHRRGDYMTIVVKKVPKFLRGIVKLIFGIKDNT